jgi:hypothetical protein
MPQVVGVHGIAQEQLGRHQLVSAWRNALADGLEVALQRRDDPVPSFDLAYYGDLFLSASAGGAPAKKGTEVEDLENLTADDLDFLHAALEEVAPPVDAVQDKGFRAVPAALRPLLNRLAIRFDMKALVALVPVLRQVRVYLDDDELATRVRSRVLETIGDGCDLLIGHSLGSVVAFETLALNTDLHVGSLITLGSPLSMRTVADRLRGQAGPSSAAPLPGPVRSWVNVFDEGDPVSAGGPVGRLWAGAQDYTVDNGDQPHSVTRYLSKRISGERVFASIADPP